MMHRSTVKSNFGILTSISNYLTIFYNTYALEYIFLLIATIVPNKVILII